MKDLASRVWIETMKLWQTLDDHLVAVELAAISNIANTYYSYRERIWHIWLSIYVSVCALILWFFIGLFFSDRFQAWMENSLWSQEVGNIEMHQSKDLAPTSRQWESAEAGVSDIWFGVMMILISMICLEKEGRVQIQSVKKVEHGERMLKYDHLYHVITLWRIIRMSHKTTLLCVQ